MLLFRQTIDLEKQSAHMNAREQTRAKILGVLIRDARLYRARTEAECAQALNIPKTN